MSRFSRSRRQKEVKAMTDIPLTPLIDTALTLLVIFMVSTPVVQQAIKVNLPRGQAQEEKGANQQLIVYLDSESKISFNGTSLTQEALFQELKKVTADKKDQTVFVRADRAVSYGTVVELVDQIKVVGGIKYVALATQRRTT
jgi:biopolymer transport protein ExbD